MPSRPAPKRPSVATQSEKGLVIGSGKGGTGKTTICLNLATIAASHRLRVALLDTDPQETLTKWHERRTRHTDVPLLSLSTVPLGDVRQAISAIGEAGGIDLVIVDTPPGLEQQPQMGTLIRQADYVLVPTSQSTPDIESVREFMASVGALGTDAAYILNRTNQRWGSHRVAKRLLNQAGTLCPIDVRLLRDIEATADHGLGLNEIRGVKGLDDLEAVWEFVKKGLGV
jgi:chromosome partitioning protein